MTRILARPSNNSSILQMNLQSIPLWNIDKVYLIKENFIIKFINI